MTQDKPNIHQRISKCITHQAITECGKNGRMQAFNTSYDYFKAEDVVNACSKAMSDNGITFSIELENLEHTHYTKKTSKGEKTVHYFVLKGKAIFTNIDDENNKLETVFIGSAEDDSDKAIGKANAYAKKIALMNTFMIQDGEDTDASPSEAGIRVIEKITAKEAEDMQALSDERYSLDSSYSQSKILEHFNIQSFSELNIQQAEKVRDGLKQKIAESKRQNKTI